MLISLLKQGYHFQPFNEFLLSPKNKVVVMRHDVDRLPKNALLMAKLESELHVKSSFYFRIVKSSNHPEIINTIKELGHEIGYHYEDLNIAKGNKQKAIEYFKANLAYFRQFYPVNTICMHGSPMGKWDNRLLWNDYKYKDLGIIGEPYFDVDYNKLLYITDTGRKWNNSISNIRDKVSSGFNFSFNSTHHIIQLISQNKLPNQIMFSCHPQRWSNPNIKWVIELLTQSVKNPIKKAIIKKKCAASNSTNLGK